MVVDRARSDVIAREQGRFSSTVGVGKSADASASWDLARDPTTAAAAERDSAVQRLACPHALARESLFL